MQTFDPKNLHKLKKRSQEPENGQITIIGGSDLFHGAPILALKAASRIVDMVFFSSPEPSVGKVAENLKAKLSSFIWIPWNEIGDYIKKSDAILIGPGMKRWRKEKDKTKVARTNILDEDGTKTRFITEMLLQQFPEKLWVIDGGSLQVMRAKLIPKRAILTPNKKEYDLLFGSLLRKNNLNTEQKDSKDKNQQQKVTIENKILQESKKHKCTIVLKGPTTFVCSPKQCIAVKGGNNGLTKGGTGDVLAGLTAALAAKNEPFLASSAASWIIKAAADNLYKKAGTVYNADDLADEIPKVLGKYLQ